MAASMQNYQSYGGSQSMGTQNYQSYGGSQSTGTQQSMNQQGYWPSQAQLQAIATQNQMNMLQLVKPSREMSDEEKTIMLKWKLEEDVMIEARAAQQAMRVIETHLAMIDRSWRARLRNSDVCIWLRVFFRALFNGGRL